MYTTSMKNKSGKYEINEKDIESVIRFLKIADPENANPETAIAFLEELQDGFHNLSDNNPDKLLEIYTELKKNRKIAN